MVRVVLAEVLLQPGGRCRLGRIDVAVVVLVEAVETLARGAARAGGSRSAEARGRLRAGGGGELVFADLAVMVGVVLAEALLQPRHRLRFGLIEIAVVVLVEAVEIVSAIAGGAGRAAGVATRRALRAPGCGE